MATVSKRGSLMRKVRARRVQPEPSRGGAGRGCRHQWPNSDVEQDSVERIITKDNTAFKKYNYSKYLYSRGHQSIVKKTQQSVGRQFPLINN